MTAFIKGTEPKLEDCIGKMICPNCNKGELEIQDVLVSRTTDPKDDDLWEKMYYCPNCEIRLPICSEEEEEND